MEVKRLVLHDEHEALGAKIIPFAGFEMPVRYTSDKDEHMTVREKVGLFDVSHMGEFLIEGDKALELIQYVTSNDASKLAIGGVQYAYFPNEKGGVIDDLLVYRLADDKYMLVVNASNIDKDWGWIEKWNEKIKAEIHNVSNEMCLFALQGPRAAAVMNQLSDKNLEDLTYYTSTKVTLAGVPNILVSATGYTGAGGYEIYVPIASAKLIWQSLLKEGESHGIQPIGLGARDTLRLEMGYCLYGNDVTDETSPLEAGLGWVTKFSKEFVGKSVIKEQKEKGLSKKLVGFKMIDKGIPRHGYDLSDGDKIIGNVTSGSLSPMLNCGIGLGYVNLRNAIEGHVFVVVRNKKLKAEIVKLPFV